MRIGNVYFYTATILKWRNLLKPEKYKQLILSSLRYLHQQKKINVYGFVIMPNHIHLIWELIDKNGRELPHASLLKFTAHAFLQDLRQNHPQVLPVFQVDESNRKYNFWQRDSLAVLLYNQTICAQKLDYLHLNPLQEKWNLAESPKSYFWSSAKFYETGVDVFRFLDSLHG